MAGDWWVEEQERTRTSFSCKQATGKSNKLVFPFYGCFSLGSEELPREIINMNIEGYRII